MRVVLSTLNAKFIHSSLALKYLKSWCDKKVEFCEIVIDEYNINDPIESIAGNIFRAKPEVIAFSCYVWNIEKTLKVCSIIKAVDRNIKIIIGGPEVTYETDNIKSNKNIDFIIKGEGEKKFEALLKSINAKEYLEIIHFEDDLNSIIKDLDQIPSTYAETDFSELESKIIYYESSRGCPYNCQYCLSSKTTGVRYFSMERVKMDLSRLIEFNAPQIKFVDRTFNSNKDRAIDIWNFLIDKKPTTNFHFEICADLLDEDMLNVLKKAPKGLFQFEIGVQSTNPKTIEAINRKMNLSRLFNSVNRISSYKNIHQHLDLIVGLPYETYKIFRKSFNDIYNLKPEKLQMGFLKLLKGSGISKQKYEFGYECLEYPPYEVLKNRWLTYKEILRLKLIEDLLEKYYNSHKFKYTLQFIIERYFNDPFDFYESLSKYFEEENLHNTLHSNETLYRILYEFCVKKEFNENNIILEILKFDYLLYQKNPKIPKWFYQPKIKEFRERCFEFLKKKENINKYLPKYKGMTTKKIFNMVNFHIFKYDIPRVINNYKKDGNFSENKTIILFDYYNKKIVKEADYYSFPVADKSFCNTHLD